MFKSIVVAYDGSAHASRALDIGAEMASRLDASLGIVYVIDRAAMHIPEEIHKMFEVEQIIDPKPRSLIDLRNAPAAMMSTMTRVGSDSLAAMYEYAEWLVKHAEDCARREGAGDIETRILEGNPAEQVVAFAEERNADLIVCGCRGLGNLTGTLLGSVSNKILHRAGASCLTVK